MPMRAWHSIICLAIALTVLFCGCLTVEVHSKVDVDATVSSYSFNLTTNQFVYDALKESAKEQGYATLRESLLSQTEPGTIEYSEVWDGDTVTIRMDSLRPTQLLDPGNWTVQKVDGYMIYRDARFVSNESTDDSEELVDESDEFVDDSDWLDNGSDEFIDDSDWLGNESDEFIDDSDWLGNEADDLGDALLSGVSLHYYLEMPGKIVDTNANTVNGNKAEWHLTGTDVFTTEIYAKSEVPALALPGFSALAALAGLACALVCLYRKNR